MDSGELHDFFRTDIFDTAAPYLWSDDEVYRYMDDAQRMFCRFTGGLGDATTDSVTKLALTGADVSTAVPPVGVITYPLSPLILKVRDAYYETDGDPVGPVNYENLAAMRIRLDARNGRPRYLILGMQPKQLRVYPNPLASETIRLVVDRLPLYKIVTAGQPLEIDEQHHLHLVKWMRALAYAKQDAETYDKTKSAENEAAFRKYCDEARKEKERAMHRTRVVAYGGL